LEVKVDAFDGHSRDVRKKIPFFEKNNKVYSLTID
jgi:hypothetical protein